MLFNSSGFIFLFLPIAFLGFYALARNSHAAAASFLFAASLVFYYQWGGIYTLLLLISIVINYFFGVYLSRHKNGWVLAGAIGGNLTVLAYYKYWGFIGAQFGLLLGNDIVLPLGISFFTFTQIAFLVDAYRRIASEFNPVHYGLFVTYFPHLIAGPVLHHKQMMPQFGRSETYHLNYSNIAIGITIFFIGLFKKVILADGIMPYVNPVFATSASSLVTFLDAWAGAIAYALQIYFDFSGYSDMAIGISRLFGVTLPLNFNSPYKAESIIDFWRRWHMTLSRFLKEYLYIPLGGNRCGKFRRHTNLFATMLLGGMWHGAGWGFIVWGGLHGLYLVINHVWNGWTAKCNSLGVLSRSRPYRIAAKTLTLLVVVVAWVFFRSSSLDQALSMVVEMSGAHGICLPQRLAPALGDAGNWLADHGVLRFLQNHNFVLHDIKQTVIWIVVLSAIALFSPNTQEILSRYKPALDCQPKDNPMWEWHPNPKNAVFLACIAAVSILSLGSVTAFLYFQF